MGHGGAAKKATMVGDDELVGDDGDGGGARHVGGRRNSSGAWAVSMVAFEEGVVHFAGQSPSTSNAASKS
ncbi:uncharacterized protein A4U43_C08F21590 [Asparagus officinalis]|nr:uncharacterized protein A4U43_C08F21590 [Asparagus officinalis]